jgi:integrase
LAEHFGKAPEVPFPEALLRYAKVQKRDHPRTFMRSTRYRLKHLQERFGKFNISEITLKVVRDYMDERLETVNLATAQKDVSILRAILNLAFREGHLERQPRFPRFKSVKGRDRWLTREEENRLLAHASRHLAPILRFAVDTGGRLSEILRLDWREVDLKGGRVRFVETKNGEDRTVRLCRRALGTLSGLGPKDSGPVFLFRGKPMQSVKTAFDKARLKAGLPDVRFHDLRHTFASRLVQGGVPLYDVMHLTGHKSLQMVQRYAHLAPDYQERAIRALDGLGHNLGTGDGQRAA